VIRSRLLNLAGLLLAMTFATGASGAAAPVMPPDDAPFWTGQPDSAAFQAR
jgi:hypothetical protein